VNKVLAKLLISALALVLMVYTGMRSVNFIMMTLPADRQILAFFALACLEGGMLGWLYYFLKGAEGIWQRGISIVMVVIDFLGSSALFTADTLIESASAGMTTGMSSEEIRTVLLVLSGVIALNVGAKIGCWAMDPHARKERAEAEAFDKIDDLAIKRINENSDQLAEELAGGMTEVWQARTRAVYSQRMAQISASAGGVIDAKAHDLPAAAQPARPGGVRLPWQRQPAAAQPARAFESSIDYDRLAAAVVAAQATQAARPLAEQPSNPGGAK